MADPTIPNYPPQGIQAQLDLLYLYNPDAANKLMAELQAGLTDLKELEARILSELGGLQDVVHLRGTVTTEQDLPAEHDKGDLWEVSSTGTLYIWDGAVWKQLGGASTLPTQEGNAGKFLSTDGEKLLWAEVQQGGGSSDAIEWFALFSATPQQINAVGGSGAGLRFDMPELPEGTYAFYSNSTGLPMGDDGKLFSNKVRYTVFEVDAEGNLGAAISYFASSNEQAYTGNASGTYQQVLWNVVGKTWFTEANNYEGRSEINVYSTIDKVYQTVAISKIKNLITGAEYEPLNVSQWFVQPEDYVPGRQIFRQELVSMSYSDYATSTYSTVYGLNVAAIALYNAPNPWWTDYVGNPSRNSIGPHKHITVLLWNASTTDRLVLDLEYDFDGVKATKVLATGTFDGDYTLATTAEDFAMPTELLIHRTDGQPLATELELYGQIVWDANAGNQNITSGGANIPDTPVHSMPFIDADKISKEWVTNNFINADASTYTLASLQDAFTFSNARLMKVFNETKMPTTDTYTLFSLGWTYNDSNNAPSLIAVNLATGKLYFYQGTYENCSAEAWQEFAFGEGGAAGGYLPLAGGVLTGPLQFTTSESTSAPAKISVSAPYNLLRFAAGASTSINNTMAITGDAVTSNNLTLGQISQAWRRAYIKEIATQYGGNLTIPKTAGTLARLEDLPNIPTQEGNNGKVLSTNGTTMEWIDLPTAPGANQAPAGTYSEYGVKGDYCSTYAVIKTPNGRPYIKSGATNTVVVPAGMVLDCPLSGEATDESKGLITIGSEQEVEIEETTDCYLVYVRALGEFRACNTLCFTPVQPEDGTEPCKMWFDGAKWWFKSDDTGNVWRTTRAHPVCKCIFTDGVLTRLNFIGWYDIVPDAE